jgi:hypothetical protein
MKNKLEVDQKNKSKVSRTKHTETNIRG